MPDQSPSAGSAVVKASEVLAQELATLEHCYCPDSHEHRTGGAGCACCRGGNLDFALLAQVPGGHDLVVRQDGTLGWLESVRLTVVTDEFGSTRQEQAHRVRPLSSPVPEEASNGDD